MRASISIPGVFVPAAFAQEVDCYVDGGLRDGYPLNIAVRLGKAQASAGSESRLCRHAPGFHLVRRPLEILNQSLDIMMWAQFKDRLQDRALAGSRLITINPLIYNISTFEVEYIPEMIARGYEVAIRLFRERGLTAGESGNRNAFSGWCGRADFPGERTAPISTTLLEHQIKRSQRDSWPSQRIAPAAHLVRRKPWVDPGLFP